MWKISLEEALLLGRRRAGPRGASWGEDGSIVFTTTDAGLARVTAEGGEVETLTRLDPTTGERSHRWPELLPGGRAVLFTISNTEFTTFDEAQIAVLSFAAGESRVLIERGTYPRYVPSGHILYGRGGALLAVPFDMDSLELVGSPVTVIDDLATFDATGAAQFAASRRAPSRMFPVVRYPNVGA